MAYADIGLRVYTADPGVLSEYGSGVLVLWVDDDPDDHHIRLRWNNHTYGVPVNCAACGSLYPPT
jgi:hypothetical protein